MSRCRRVRGLLGPYLYGEVSSAERALVEKHLGQCQVCRREFESGRVTVGALAEGLFAPDEQVRRRLEARVAAALAPSRPELARTGRPWGRVAVALAAGLLLCCGLVAWSHRGTTPRVVVAPPQVSGEVAALPGPPAPPLSQSATAPPPALGKDIIVSRQGPRSAAMPRVRQKPAFRPSSPAPATAAPCVCVAPQMPSEGSRAPAEASPPPIPANDACVAALPVALEDNDARLVELPTGSSEGQPGGVPR
jgi:hypothetical protein